VRQLHLKNLIIPVVGDFAGPKALVAIGRFLKDYDTPVTAFYVSNVESYLRPGGKIPAFCQNVATLPITDKSVLLRGIAPMTYANIASFIQQTAGC
jgi:hypothetical protein